MMKELMTTILGKENIARAVSRDWLLKFISICLAVVLWYYVGGEDRVDKNVMIPIEIINLPRDLVISNQFKKEIEVTVSGPRSLILDMSKSSITRQVDLSAAVPGTMVIENGNKHIPVPRGITVQRVQPSSIILSLDKLIHKEFQVSAKTVGRVARGYYLEQIQTDPEVISITGPATVLSPLEELYTKAINLDELKESVQMQVPLELDPSIVDLIGETSVTADLQIGVKIVTKTLKGLKVHVVVDGVLRAVVPEVVKVTANIPKLLINKKTDLKKLFSVTAVQIDGDDMLRVEVVPRADIELPIEILSVIPSSVLLIGEGESVTGIPLPARLLGDVRAVTAPDMEPSGQGLAEGEGEGMEDIDTQGDNILSEPSIIILTADKKKTKIAR